MAKISSVVASTDSSAKEVADVLKLDPVIVSKVLRLANSAYVGMPNTVSSLQNAIVLLGQKRISALVTSALVTSALSGDNAHFALKSFWRHSTGVALIAESIAKHLQRYHMVEPDVCFSAAILHDIGKLIIARIDPNQISDVVARALESKKPYFESETEGLSHTSVGSELAQLWHFPDDLVQTIAYHHTIPAGSTVAFVVHIVHLADSMAHTIGLHSFEGEVLPRVNDESLAAVALPLERLRVIAEEILQRQNDVDTLAEFFS